MVCRGFHFAKVDLYQSDATRFLVVGNELLPPLLALQGLGSSAAEGIAAARAKSATPFKRPENGQFRPGSNFTEFYFDETGDTDNLTPAGVLYGGFGALFKLVLNGDNGQLSLLYLGDQVHAGFDNGAFWDADHIVFVEDAGDTLDEQHDREDERQGKRRHPENVSRRPSQGVRADAQVHHAQKFHRRRQHREGEREAEKVERLVATSWRASLWWIDRRRHLGGAMCEAEGMVVELSRGVPWDVNASTPFCNC
jgi:hypothetical protein